MRKYHTDGVQGHRPINHKKIRAREARTEKLKAALRADKF